MPPNLEKTIKFKYVYMKKRMKYILLLWIIPMFTYAQQEYTVRGEITNQFGDPVAYVNVIFSIKEKYAVTNEEGNYVIDNIQKGSYTIRISSIGYKTIEKSIIVNKNLKLDFILEESLENLDSITVKSKKVSTKQKEKAIAIGSFELADIATQTTVITDAIDQISGVRVRRSGSLGDDSDISINGLSGNSVRTFIDGVPLEFLYPGLDLVNLPLSGIKRVDVYKGVLPVDISADALGGGINIVTANKTENNIRTSYSIGSFNTHLVDLDVTLVDKNNNYLKVNGGINYSDNDYTFNADIRVDHPSGNGTETIENQNIRRFHDAYRLQFTGFVIGTSDKKWTDRFEIGTNYLNSFKELQNGLIITNTAIGEAFQERENVSVTLRYDKTIIKDKLKLKSISNYNDERRRIIDTTSNTYNWLGQILEGIPQSQLSPGESNTSPNNAQNDTEGFANRTTLNFKFNDNHKLLLSNLLARNERITTLFNFLDPTQFTVFSPQKVFKDIAGLQYEGNFLDRKLQLTIALKNYNYKLSGTRLTRTGETIPAEQKDNFIGQNASFRYKLTPDLIIRGSYERGFLIPQINQFAGDNLLTLPNTEITAEESDNYNIGIRYNRSFNDSYALTVTANAFLRQQRGIIFRAPTAATGRFENDSDANSKGLEGDITFKFLKEFTLNTNISYIDKTFEGFQNLGNENEFLLGTPFPNTPNFFYNTQLSWKKDNIFKTDIDIRLYGLFNHVDAFNRVPVGKNDTEESRPDLFVLEQNRIDWGISLEYKNTTIAFNAINITDEDLFDNFSIPRPGINYNFKLIYELSNF